MNGVKCSDRNRATASGRLPSGSFRWAAIFNLLSLILALAVTGCATPASVRSPAQAPPVQLSESTWWQVDSDIGATSLAAAGAAKDYARGAVETWRARVAQQAETDFIPWFTSYWTQQWLSIKMAWYQLNAKEGADTAVNQLATYLREQYQDRVLKPVAQEIDPEVVREEATRLYIRSLDEQLQAIPARDGVPPDQFDRRLENIPAIALAPPRAHDASIYQLVNADPIDALPAYTALIARIRKDAGTAGSGLLDARISPMARRTSETLADKIAGSGGASAASALFRGVASMMISAGAAAFGAIAYEQERPELEAQLRKNLDATLDEMSSGLMEDRATGVLAGVHYISEQIEQSIPKTVTYPVKFE